MLAAPAYVALDERIMRDLARPYRWRSAWRRPSSAPLIATDRTDPVTGTLDLDSVSVSAT